jgi:acetyl esterase
MTIASNFEAFTSPSNMTSPKLDQDLQRWLDHYNQLLAAWRAKGVDLTPEMARDGLATLTTSHVTTSPSVAMVMDEPLVVDGRSISLRIYHPAPDKRCGVIIYLHGGGHMAGSVTVYDPICRKLAVAANHIVISVDYRLAPEHPYPAGLKDAAAVISHYRSLLAALNIDYSERLVVAGDSAGGAMSATMAHRFQDDDATVIDKLILIYPSLDYTMSHPSIDELADGYLLERERIAWYFARYFQDYTDRRGASPLSMDISPSFPAALVCTAGFCPLRDEGFAYVGRLEKNGNSVVHHHYPGMIHAFLNLEDIVADQSSSLYERIGKFLAT